MEINPLETSGQVKFIWRNFEKIEVLENGT